MVSAGSAHRSGSHRHRSHLGDLGHFGLDGAERGRQASRVTGLVAEVVAGVDDLVIVGGDLNATPDMPATARISGALRDAWDQAGDGQGWTFPASAPMARIDYVFVGEGGSSSPRGLAAKAQPGVGPPAGRRRRSP